MGDYDEDTASCIGYRLASGSCGTRPAASRLSSRGCVSEDSSGCPAKGSSGSERSFFGQNTGLPQATYMWRVAVIIRRRVDRGRCPSHNGAPIREGSPQGWLTARLGRQHRSSNVELYRPRPKRPNDDSPEGSPAYRQLAGIKMLRTPFWSKFSGAFISGASQPRGLQDLDCVVELSTTTRTCSRSAISSFDSRSSNRNDRVDSTAEPGCGRAKDDRCRDIRSFLVPAMYAATIHKSQGYEIPVAIIPVLTQHYPMLPHMIPWEP